TLSTRSAWPTHRLLPVVNSGNLTLTASRMPAMKPFVSAAILAAYLISRVVGQEPPPVREPAIKPADRRHWAFQLPSRPPIPSIRHSSWGRPPVATFVLAKLEAAGLEPAPEADRLTLIRRVTVDLTGLPPTPEEQDAFLNDPRPDAYERVVERLLASPHHG